MTFYSEVSCAFLGADRTVRKGRTGALVECARNAELRAPGVLLLPRAVNTQRSFDADLGTRYVLMFAGTLTLWNRA